LKAKLFLVLSAFLFIALLAACKPGRWREYSNQEGKFSVLLPGKPDETVQNVDTAAGAITTYRYQIDSNNTSFAVAYTDYPADLISLSNPEELLNEAREGALSNIQGKLLEEQQVKVNGFPGRHLRIESSGSKMMLEARIFLVDSRLYQVLAAYRTGSVEDREITKFLNSFKLAR
jgi:hypothetical protein